MVLAKGQDTLCSFNCNILWCTNTHKHRPRISILMLKRNLHFKVSVATEFIFPIIPTCSSPFWKSSFNTNNINRNQQEEIHLRKMFLTSEVTALKKAAVWTTSEDFCDN